LTTGVPTTVATYPVRTFNRRATRAWAPWSHAEGPVRSTTASPFSFRSFFLRDSHRFFLRPGENYYGKLIGSLTTPQW